MSKYRKVDPRIWNDAKFTSLDDSAKLVFFMLLTHPSMTALGAMRATLSGLAEELGWESEAFREAFAKVCDKGMAEHDKKACLVALPNFLRYNPPESPNVIKAWVAALDMLPECALKTRVVARSKAFAEGLTKGFAEALPEVFAKGMPYQEQEQEQEPEQEVLAPTVLVGDKPPTEKKAKAPTCPFQKIADAWVEATRSLAVPKPVAEWSDARKAAMRARWREKWDLGKYHDEDAGVAYWRKLFAFVEASDFLTGRAAPSFGRDTPFFADIDWVFNQKNLSKIIEGKYVNREPEAVPA